MKDTNNKAYILNPKIITEMNSDKDFQQIINKTLKAEGGYKPADGIDTGGETNMGITKKWYPNEDIKNMTKERASYIYYNDYYKTNGIDKLPLEIKEIVFDNGVNQGQGTAVKNLQKAIGVREDGVIGEQTLNQLEKYDTQSVKSALKIIITDRYSEIIKRDPKQIEFKNGWINRTNDY